MAKFPIPESRGPSYDDSPVTVLPPSLRATFDQEVEGSNIFDLVVAGSHDRLRKLLEHNLGARSKEAIASALRREGTSLEALRARGASSCGRTDARSLLTTSNARTPSVVLAAADASVSSKSAAPGEDLSHESLSSSDCVGLVSEDCSRTSRTNSGSTNTDSEADGASSSQGAPQRYMAGRAVSHGLADRLVGLAQSAPSSKSLHSDKGQWDPISGSASGRGHVDAHLQAKINAYLGSQKVGIEPGGKVWCCQLVAHNRRRA